jgi:hypothetical protein
MYNDICYTNAVQTQYKLSECTGINDIMLYLAVYTALEMFVTLGSVDNTSSNVPPPLLALALAPPPAARRLLAMRMGATLEDAVGDVG